MKAMRKIMASLLALTMAASAGIGALADDDKIETNGGAATVPVTIAAAQATTFSVKVPSSLPLTIKADGSVEVPTNLVIENDSAGPVKVTKIEATKGSWGLAKFNSDFDAMAVNAKKLGFKLNAATTIDSADDTQELANFDEADWTIGGNKKLPITVAADASAVSEAVKDVSAASVIFTIAWDYADGTTQNAGGQSGGGESEQPGEGGGSGSETGGSESGGTGDTDAGEKVTFTTGTGAMLYGVETDPLISHTVAKGTTLGQWLASEGKLGSPITLKDGTIYGTFTGPDWAIAYFKTRTLSNLNASTFVVFAGDDGVPASTAENDYTVVIRTSRWDKGFEDHPVFDVNFDQYKNTIENGDNFNPRNTSKTFTVCVKQPTSVPTFVPAPEPIT